MRSCTSLSHDRSLREHCQGILLFTPDVILWKKIKNNIPQLPFCVPTRLVVRKKKREHAHNVLDGKRQLFFHLLVSPRDAWWHFTGLDWQLQSWLHYNVNQKGILCGAGAKALHPSATCRSAWVIHGSHFVSKSHRASVCREKEADSCSASRQSAQKFSRCACEIWKGPFWVQKPLHAADIVCCSFARLASCCFPVFNNSPLEEGGFRVLCIYPFTLEPCNVIGTNTHLPVLPPFKIIRFLSAERKK